MSKKSSGTKIFIGRQEEIHLFNEMLMDTEGPKWVLSFVAKGGLGKTQLLYELNNIARQNQTSGKKIIVTDGLIDFYWTANQREIGVLETIIEKLEVKDYFSDTLHQIDYYRQAYHSRADSERLKNLEVQIRNKFIADYTALAQTHQIVLFFDTTEIVCDFFEDLWLNVLGKLRNNTLLVLAGRLPLRGLPQEETFECHIGGFSTQDIFEYFAQHGIRVEQTHLERIAELSNGKPILIALVVDWIKEGHSLAELTSFEKNAPEKFERALVEHIQKLKSPEDQVILAMSHLYRRFNEEVLIYLLDGSSSTAISLMENLSRFTFVKYFPPERGMLANCFLHDEMRRLVDEYVWSNLDPLFEYRADWSRKVIDYYDSKIQIEKDLLERENLSLEKLHYLAEADIEEAFKYSTDLFNEAFDRKQWSLISALNTELESFDNKMTVLMKREFMFRKALKLQYKTTDGAIRVSEAYDEYIQLINVSRRSLLEVRCLAQLVEICASSGKPRQALEYGVECESVCQSLLGEVKDEWERKEIRETMAQVYNNMGFTYRSALGDLEQAREYYEKALNQPELPVGLIAQVRNNLAFVYARQGRINEALSLAKASLRLRLETGTPNEISVSYNVLGMIYASYEREKEAAWAFDEALRYANLAQYNLGKGYACISYGRLLRQIGWHTETPENASVIDGIRKISSEDSASQSPDEQIESNLYYKKAFLLLNDAVSIFSREGSWAYLSEAHNELGCLYRQVDAVSQSLQYFKSSLEFAKKAENIFRELDTLLDMAILFYRSGQLEEAKKYAIDVNAKIIGRRSLEYLFAKSQHLLANINYQERNYEDAFRCAADACVYNVKQKSKPRAYDDVLDSISRLLRGLPSYELLSRYAMLLKNRWKQEGLEDRYPGFATEMDTILADYALLKLSPGH